MATVYLAEDPLLQRLVAIKVIQAHLSSNSSLMDRFTVEAKTIASLRHVNIVEVFDFGIQDDQQYLVMEYIDGQNLQAMCAAITGKAMDNTVAAAIICQAAEGLTSAEKHGVVHRDIKPENLMFNSEGQLKIADFGIAHIADEQSRTQTGAVLGSPNFMSPEQIEGLRPTNKTDLFSLGGVFYYCLTGKMPFTGPSIPVTMRNICEKAPPSILEINPGADPFLIKLTDLLLQKLPENRAESARWLANQLRAYLGQHSIVDVADHCKTFIGTLGLGQNQTIAGPGSMSKPGFKPTRGTGGSSVAGLPSQVIKTGTNTMGAGNMTQSKSMAGQSQFNTQATTGAMGPSSRSPLVWVGALLSLCVLVLAGAIFWSRMDKGETESATNAAGARPSDRVAGSPGAGKPPATAAPTTPPVTTPIPATPAATSPETPANPTTLAATTPTVRPDPTPVKLPRNPDRPQVARPPRNPVPEKQPTPTKPPEVNESTGFVLIKSAPPFAALTINGKPQGETPMNAYLEVPVGKCHIEIVHRLSPPFDTLINITPGFRREYKFKLDR